MNYDQADLAHELYMESILNIIQLLLTHEAVLRPWGHKIFFCFTSKNLHTLASGLNTALRQLDYFVSELIVTTYILGEKFGTHSF